MNKKNENKKAKSINNIISKKINAILNYYNILYQKIIISFKNSKIKEKNRLIIIFKLYNPNPTNIKI